MKRTKLLMILLIGIAVTISLASCGLSVPTQPPDEMTHLIYTQAVQTVVAEMTLVALQTPTATFRPPSPTPEPSETPTFLPTEVEPTLTSQPTATLQPTPISLPTHTPTLILQRQVVLEDDFRSASRGWYVELAEDWAFEYVDGIYRIYNNRPGAAVWSVRDFELVDTILEVDVARRYGPEDGYYGAICRFQSNNNYYALVLSSNGFHGIARMKDAQYEFLLAATDASGVIHATEANRLRAECIGARLALYANDELLVEVNDDSFTQGKIGLVAGNSSVSKGIDAAFDNLVLYSVTSR